ncbi:MAG: L-histidine N(alpha)-methyltransferase [Gammaproteobacteria bacterium]
MSTPAFSFYDQHPKPADFFQEVISGLSQLPRFVPPKFFYDEYGSQLFDRICATPEYYPTRTEIDILRRNAPAIAEHVGRDCLLIEPGSGNSAKVRELLGPLAPRLYMPVDISKAYLRDSAARLAHEYPWLEVRAACTDFTEYQALPELPDDGRRVAFFPGSSVGNFEPDEARRFLAYIAETVGEDGGLLIGVDLKKDSETLNAAYNDAAGATAAFNLNILTRINRELGADFNLEGFSHYAFYNQDLGRVEMHLVSRLDQRVIIDGHDFDFCSGESIHTESSYKYTVDEFSALAAQAGFHLEALWIDRCDLFSVQFYSCSRAANQVFA